jgi:hypothetical protein
MGWCHLYGLCRPITNAVGGNEPSAMDGIAFRVTLKLRKLSGNRLGD